MSKESDAHHSYFYMGVDGSYFFNSYGLPPTKEVEMFVGNGV